MVHKSIATLFKLLLIIYPNNNSRKFHSYEMKNYYIWYRKIPKVTFHKTNRGHFISFKQCYKYTYTYTYVYTSNNNTTLLCIKNEEEKKTTEKDKHTYKRYKYKDEEEGFFVTRLDEHTRLRVFVFHSQCGWNDTDDALLPLEKGG